MQNKGRHFAFCILHFVFCLSFLIFLCPPPLPAQDLSPLLFTLETIDGLSPAAPLEQIGEDWSVSLGGSRPLEAKGTDVVSLRRARAPLPAPPREEFVLFANGDRVAGEVQQLTGERLRFGIRFRSRPEPDQDLTLPLTALSVLWFGSPDGVDDAEALLRRLAAQRRRRDAVHLRNGDVVEGTLTALDRDSVRLQDENHNEVKLERERVALIALNTELQRSLRPRGTYGRLVLGNGSRLSLASARSADRILSGKTLFGVAVQIPVAELIALDLFQGRAVYLSDLKPRRYEHTPYLGVRWPYVLDGSVAGHPLRLAGGTYDKGLGLHSACRISYDLGRRYQWFTALVGLDDRTGREGSVRIQVLVDGKPQDLGRDDELTGRDAPRALRVRVAGARELTLVVDFGRHGDVGDHVDWADARLIKEKG
jgi:hypothetical protein